MSDYRVIIEQDEDGVYCASCPELPGCFSHGETHDEAMRSMREAMDLHLEVVSEQSLRNTLIYDDARDAIASDDRDRLAAGFPYLPASRETSSFF